MSTQKSEETCVHWWLIGDIAGLPKNEGTCKLCGAVKTFTVYFTDLSYYDLNQYRPDVQDYLER